MRNKLGIYPEQIFVFILVLIVWWAMFYISITTEQPSAQRPIYPQSPDFWTEAHKAARAMGHRQEPTSRMPNSK